MHSIIRIYGRYLWIGSPKNIHSILWCEINVVSDQCSILLYTIHREPYQKTENQKTENQMTENQKTENQKTEIKRP